MFNLKEILSKEIPAGGGGEGGGGRGGRGGVWTLVDERLKRLNVLTCCQMSDLLSDWTMNV